MYSIICNIKLLREYINIVFIRNIISWRLESLISGDRPGLTSVLVVVLPSLAVLRGQAALGGVQEGVHLHLLHGLATDRDRDRDKDTDRDRDRDRDKDTDRDRDRDRDKDTDRDRDRDRDKDRDKERGEITQRR